MKSRRFHRGLSVFLSMAMVASCATAGSAVLAADSQPPAGDQAIGKAQPHFPGYRIKDIQNWDRDTDPGADLMRARVPLQQRNEAFQATQADPTLTDDAKVMLMQGDYGNSFFDSMIYNNDFSEHCFNFWQYADLWSPWHGAATAYSPKSLEELGFKVECGMINIPNPAYTNAAHKNGVKSIACMYFDPSYRPGQSINELLERDEEGNFLVVDKLVEMAEYYGYDGYFLNEEDYPAAGDGPLQELMQQLTQRGMYTQYYKGFDSRMHDGRKPWLTDSEGNKVCDSIFTDYSSWGDAVSTGSADWCRKNGYDPYDVAFLGLECNRGGLNSTPGPGGFLAGSKNLKASIALFTPSDHYQRGLVFSNDGGRPAFQQSRFQWMVTERERIFFSGARQDPSDTDFTGSVDWSSVNAGNVSGHGVAEYISERSVVSGSTFYTNFNTGHGMQYFADGELSHDDEWAHIGIQDILPTWQWWMESDGTKLDVDFDYGVKYVRADKSGNDIGTPYQKVGAYQGGSSLVVYGGLDSENYLRLYKTDLSVKDDTKLSVTYQKPSGDDGSKMEIGVIFKSAPETVVTFNVPDSGKQTDGWVSRQVSLGDYSGEEIATLGLVFSDGGTGVPGYQMNIGELKVTDGGDYTPAAPTGLRIRAAYDSREMILQWDLADYDTVDKYNVYANLSDGRRVHMGGAYDGVYYVKDAMAGDAVTMEVTAVGKDGSESEPATIDFAYNQNVSDIVVDEAKDANGLTLQAEKAGYLDISWTRPNVDYENLLLTLKQVDVKDGGTYEMTVDGQADSARFYIPSGHGQTYDLFISTVFEDGTQTEPVAYRGALKDVWSQPIDRRDVKFTGRVISFINPASVDWFRIHVYADGKEFYTGTRGKDTINRGASIPSNAVNIDVVLEDFSGNMSEPVRFEFGTAETPDGPINASNVPDETLRRIILEQVGSTLKEAAAFTGVLDLSGLEIADYKGLELVVNAAEVKLCGSTLDNLGGIILGDNVARLDLSGCTNLEFLTSGTLPTAPGLRELDITGCSSLRVLEVKDSSVEKLSYGDASEFPNLIRVDFTGSRFDMSKGTPERAFADAIAPQTSPDKSINESDSQESNLAGSAKASVLEGSFYNISNINDNNLDNYGYGYGNGAIALDLGSVQKITGYRVTFYSASYAPYAYNVEYSSDGINYTTFDGQITSRYEKVHEYHLSGKQDARYIRFTAQNGSYYYINELEVLGYAGVSYDSEVVYGNQRPRLISGDINPVVSLTRGSGLTVNPDELLTDLLQNAAVTVRGTRAAQLIKEDFIDPAYHIGKLLEEPITGGKEIHVANVVDSQGNVSHGVIDGSRDGEYTVDYVTYDSANAEGETLYTINLKIRGITSILEQVIANAEQLAADGALNNTMEAVVTEFNAALQAAKDLLEQDYASQEEINAATIRLLAVMAKVDWKQGDKTNLEVAVAVAEAIEPNLDLYVDECVQPFKDALTRARELLASGNAWDDDIKAATVALIDAMSDMRMKADKGILNEMIEKAQGYDLSRYTAESAEAVRAALAKAKDLAADDNAIQEAVDEAANTLQAALSGLTLNNSNGGANNPAGSNGATTPVGDGSAPTKTGDAFSAAGLTTLALLSAAGAIWLLRKRK